MGKCVFKEYQIKLHGNTYQIFIPDTVFDEFWVMPDGYFGVEYDWVAGNRTAMKWIRNAYIALTKYQNSIVYFPVRNITPVYMNCCWQIPPELLLYHHHIQFKRKAWKKIKACMTYQKPKQRVVYWNMDELREQHEQMLRQWRKNHSYYQYRYAERLYYQYETCFLEGSRK